MPSTPQWLESWTPAGGARRVRTVFSRAFDGGAPDGVWFAPGRVNLIGEHTDYNAGLCLPTALPHRTYVALRAREDDVVRLVSAQAPDEPWETKLSEVAPGSVGGWGSYVAGVAWALAEAGHTVHGFDAAVDSCVPFGAGLSSSASLECAFAVAIDDVSALGLADDDAGRTELVDACRRAENEIAGAPTGGLDQSASLRCAEGRALLLDFRPGLSAVESGREVPFDPASAGLELLVVDTRAPHALVDGQYGARRAACERAAALLGLANLREIAPDGLDAALAELAPHDGDGVLARRVRHVVTETERTARFVELVSRGLVAEVGPLMTASHASLRDDYEVSCRELDLVVDTAMAAGAVGARMTGGGFGGSAIALVPRDDVERVATTVDQAFADAGLAAPAFLAAPPSAGAGAV
ncbi:galactokinase [Myceligenerans salitolerans]|uniref:Galactokinase n=1 Tax=Myceligenerans salitolerans TaxID=1230528 RepID=A0ABS3I6D2_9MICO|nr:galactokinase [Myceligenerans salitolerans]MBO0608529.1 galactokinase [Myceligenerans salitolerans]